ncbi:putative dolichyldiphosphatase [Amphibalanus amphitrite]|uniref:Putative dolichyldiphosphatase n=1 Tax=Amphibalanus amphitrite TaxID=1232801 RepID=A0A6A4VGU8_AMPAM|nr:putative dolichyldiphosphatase [Amphibalanus amphitrite]
MLEKTAVPKNLIFSGFLVGQVIYVLISFALGVAVCELLNIMLKHWIREERPARKRTSFGHYGMPSDHAQISWFMAGYLTLFLLVRLSGFSQTISWERPMLSWERPMLSYW